MLLCDEQKIKVLINDENQRKFALPLGFIHKVDHVQKQNNFYFSVELTYKMLIFNQFFNYAQPNLRTIPNRAFASFQYS